MIVKKKNVYYVVYKYKTLNGDWRKKWERAGTSKREAEKLERKLMAVRDEGAPVATRNSTPTLSAFFYQFLETCIKPPLRAVGTYVNYQECFKRIEPKIGKVRLDKLTPMHFSVAYKEMAQEGLSASSIRMTHRTVRAALNKACQWQLLQVNPIRYADLPKQTPSPARALERKEFISLLKWSETRPIQDRLLLSLGLLCGLRIAEICGLRWRDWEKDTHRLFIRHNLVVRYLDGVDRSIYEFVCPRGKKFLILCDVKTDSSRDFIIPPDYVIDVLADAKRYYRAQKKIFRQSYRDWGFILHDGTGMPCAPDNLTHAFQNIIKAHNRDCPDVQIPHVRAHDMRHTAATMLLEENVNIKYVSRQLRHSSVSTTQNIYQHVTERMSSISAKTMDNIIGVENGVENEEKRKNFSPKKRK